MFCTNCGKQIPDDSTFCPECGASVTGDNVAEEKSNTYSAEGETVVDGAEEPVKKNNTTRIVGIVAVVAVVAVAAIAAVMLLGKGGGSGTVLGENLVYNFSKDAYFFANSEEDEIYFTSDKVFRAKDDIEGYVSYSMDRSVVAYREYDGDTYTLFYIDKEFNAVKVDVDAADVRVSDTGENIAYTQNQGGGEYDLYIYNIAKQEKNKIMSTVDGYRISENGAMAIMSDEDGIYIGGIDKDKEKISSKDDCSPISVSNDGKEAFFTAEDNLYYYNGEEAEKIDSDVSMHTSLASRTGKEILYSDNEKVYYYKAGMESPVKIASGDSMYSLRVAEPVAVRSDYSRFDSFAGRVIECGENTLVKIDSKTYEGDKLVSGVDTYKISQSGKELIYLKKDKIFKINNLNGEYKEEILYEDKDVTNIDASFDLKEIYFVDDDDTLYYFDEKEPVRISSDVDNEVIVYNNADGNLYYIEDETLYSVNKKPDTKNKVFSDDIYNCVRHVNGIAVINNDEEACYIGEVTTKFYAQN